MRIATLASLLLTSSITLSVSACGGDDDSGGGGGGGADMTSFQVRVENIAPWTVLKSGIIKTKVGGAVGALGPGDAYEIQFTAGKGQSVSFASMLGESNDWFFGPGPAGIALYDSTGAPRSGDVTGDVQVWDAGTEVNEEPGVGASTGPHQTAPDQGAVDPNTTVRALGQTVTLSDGSSFTLPAVADMIQVTLTPGNDRSFTLRIENVSDATTLVTSQGPRPIHISPAVWALHIAPAPLFDDGAADRGEGLERLAESGNTTNLGASIDTLTGFATPLSPGVFVVAEQGEPLYTVGAADRGQGLERIAEDGNPMLLAQAVSATPPDGTVMNGVFNTPAGIDAPGAVRPGSAYEFTVDAAPGDHLVFATMFGMSNDWFFGTPGGGIALFDSAGQPVSGDVTDQVSIYDAGTELDEELTIGPDTGPQQGTPDTGPADPVDQVREVTTDRYPRPASAHIRVTITPMAAN